MDSLWKEIERSARTIFRIFFGSKLSIKKIDNDPGITFFGVDLQMNFQGRKKMSLLLEEGTVNSIMKRLCVNSDTGRNNVAYDVIGEMASIIACGALADIPEKIYIGRPEKSDLNSKNYSNAIAFNSNLGKFAITLQEM